MCTNIIWKIQIQSMQTNTKHVNKYKVYTQIQSMQTNTKYTHKYKVCKQIQSIHTNTKYANKYKVYTQIQSIHTNTKYTHKYKHRQVCRECIKICTAQNTVRTSHMTDLHLRKRDENTNNSVALSVHLLHSKMSLGNGNMSYVCTDTEGRT